MRTRWGLALGAGVFAACSASLTAPEDGTAPAGPDASTEDVQGLDGGADAPADGAVPVDAGCPTCPTFEGVTALVGGGSHVFVGYRDGVARCDTVTCDRFALPEGGRAMAIDSTALELVVVVRRQLYVCTLTGTFVCTAKPPLLPIEMETSPPAYLAAGAGRISWTSTASTRLRVVDRAKHEIALDGTLTRLGAPLVRSSASVMYADAPGIYELPDGTGTGLARSDENAKYKNVRALAFGDGTLGVILASGGVSQCEPGYCTASLMLDFVGASAATDVAVGLGGVYWTSKTSGEVQRMKLGSAVPARVRAVTSPTLITTTKTHVAFVSGPHGPDVYALHFADP